MQVELEGFQVRSLRVEDAGSLALSADDPRIAANVRDSFPFPYTRRDAEDWIALVHRQEVECNFALADGARVIGGIGLELQHDVYSSSAEVGYWLAVDRWGRGIATRAVRWITGYAFEELGLLRVFATVYETNPASARVLEKAGYALEGRLRRAAVKHGRVLDTLMYAIVREEASPADPGAIG